MRPVFTKYIIYDYFNNFYIAPHGMVCFYARQPPNKGNYLQQLRIKSEYKKKGLPLNLWVKRVNTLGI